LQLLLADMVVEAQQCTLLVAECVVLLLQVEWVELLWVDMVQ
jgi:hypothetical protein